MSCACGSVGVLKKREYYRNSFTSTSLLESSSWRLCPLTHIFFGESAEIDDDSDIGVRDIFVNIFENTHLEDGGRAREREWYRGPYVDRRKFALGEIMIPDIESAIDEIAAQAYLGIALGNIVCSGKFE